VIHTIATPGWCVIPKPGANEVAEGSPMVRRSSSRCVRKGQARTENSAHAQGEGGSLEVRQLAKGRASSHTHEGLRYNCTDGPWRRRSARDIGPSSRARDGGVAAPP
jgi:hypothetical protein